MHLYLLNEAVITFNVIFFGNTRCSIAFSMFQVPQGTAATLFILSRVMFIYKSNSENGTKIHQFLTKLQTKISWLLFMAHGVVNALIKL